MNKLNQTTFGWDTELFISILQERKEPHLQPPEMCTRNQSIPTLLSHFVKGMEKMRTGWTNFTQFLTLTHVSAHSSCCFELKSTYVCFFSLPFSLHCLSSTCCWSFTWKHQPKIESFSTPSLPGVTLVLCKSCFLPCSGMCTIQRSCQGTPINLPCKLHLKVSLVSLGLWLLKG